MDCEVLVAAAFGEAAREVASGDPPPPSGRRAVVSREAAVWALGALGTSRAGWRLLRAGRPTALRDLALGVTRGGGGGGGSLQEAFFMAFQMVAPNAPAHELDALGW